MTKMLMTACSVFLFIAGANGQTAADLAKKYQHHEVYEVQPGVQMTPKFDSNGIVCEMQVEPSHFENNNGAADLRDGIDEAKIYAIIDQLVPAAERGLKLNTMEQCVGTCQTIYKYSNVAVIVLSHGHTKLIKIKWHNRSCD